MARRKQDATDNRRRDLARIHIARKDLSLNDDAYRAIVGGVMDRLGIPGQASAAKLTAQGRSVLLATFNQMGWRPQAARRDAKPAHPWKGRYAGAGLIGESGHLTSRQASEVGRLEDALGWSANPDRLLGFIERQTGKRVVSVSALKNREASKVITGLRKLHAMPYQAT